jgi:hypothetical protein
MNNTRDLKNYVRDMIVKHPELREQMLELLELCMDEIEEGASPSNEMHLCVSDINQLITNQESI